MVAVASGLEEEVRRLAAQLLRFSCWQQEDMRFPHRSITVGYQIKFFDIGWPD